jgi:hypothetical protein
MSANTTMLASAAEISWNGGPTAAGCDPLIDVEVGGLALAVGGE